MGKPLGALEVGLPRVSFLTLPTSHLPFQPQFFALVAFLSVFCPSFPCPALGVWLTLGCLLGPLPPPCPKLSSASSPKVTPLLGHVSRTPHHTHSR